MATPTTSTQDRPVAAVDPATPEHEQPPGLRVLRILRSKPVVGDTGILERRLRRLYELNTQPGESAHFCIRGKRGHAIACLPDRLIVLKAGRHAGTGFATTALTVFYGDVTSVQIRMRFLSGWIEISSPGFQGAEQKWSRSRFGSPRRDGFAQPNCVLIPRRRLALYTGPLADVRRLVAGAKPEGGQGDVIGKLERLAALRREGALDEREFAEAKRNIMDQVAASG